MCIEHVDLSQACNLSNVARCRRCLYSTPCHRPVVCVSAVTIHPGGVHARLQNSCMLTSATLVPTRVSGPLLPASYTSPLGNYLTKASHRRKYNL